AQLVLLTHVVRTRGITRGTRYLPIEEDIRALGGAEDLVSILGDEDLDVRRRGRRIDRVDAAVEHEHEQPLGRKRAASGQRIRGIEGDVAVGTRPLDSLVR